MLLTITLTQRPATDLGYLLHKSPGRIHTRQLAFGPAHVFYPEATDERCTAALLLDIDPVALSRGRREGASLEPYVNDRPYVASSFLSVAIADHFGSAMGGRSKERQELADQALPLEATLAAVPSRGGESLIRRLFEPLGYAVTTVPHPLAETFADWTESPYFTVTIRGSVRLRDLLAHLYVLIPVLDDKKHYDMLRDHIRGVPARTLRRYRQIAREAGGDPGVDALPIFFESLQYRLDFDALVIAGRSPAAARKWLQRHPGKHASDAPPSRPRRVPASD